MSITRITVTLQIGGIFYDFWFTRTSYIEHKNVITAFWYSEDNMLKVTRRFKTVVSIYFSYDVVLYLFIYAIGVTTYYLTAYPQISWSSQLTVLSQNIPFWQVWFTALTRRSFKWKSENNNKAQCIIWLLISNKKTLVLTLKKLY